jgi:acyl CoA:acetate/3-ketoacid CoA transferase beta subunit
MTTTDFSTNELMAVTAARMLEDGQNIVVGLGLPQIATLLAKATHAPHLNIIYEIGVINPEAVDTGVGIADPRLWYKCEYFTSFIGSLGQILQKGLVDVGFLGGLQVDQYGNINSTQVAEDGEVKHFTGSGGAADIASFSKKTFLIMKHQKRKIVAALDFMTTVGYLTGGDSRVEAGLPMCRDIRIITNYCVFNFNNQDRALQVESIHPGISREEIIENTGAPVRFADDLKTTDEPTVAELTVLREKIDPNKMYI